jgi:hypothetical protein
VIIQDSISIAAQTIKGFDPQFATVCVSLVGLVLALIWRYLPPKHIVDREQSRAEKGVNCEAAGHMNRVHDRLDKTQEVLHKVSETLAVVATIQKGQQEQMKESATVSTSFHKEQINRIEDVKANQNKLYNAVENGMGQLIEGQKRMGLRTT